MFLGILEFSDHSPIAVHVYFALSESPSTLTTALRNAFPVVLMSIIGKTLVAGSFPPRRLALPQLIKTIRQHFGKRRRRTGDGFVPSCRRPVISELDSVTY